MLLASCAIGPALRADDVSTGHTDRVLVFKSGRVVSGPIRPRGDGYDVELPTGRLFVGSEQVWLIADSLPKAHQMMRDSIRRMTPDTHMQIAAWCAENRLWGTARRELLEALHLDPHREDVRQMLAKVIRRQEAAAGPSPDGEAAADEFRKAIKLGLVTPRRSLGGLSPELAREFTRRIQPVLSSRCAGCHDTDSGRSFVFKSVRRGSTAELAEQNLLSVLGQLNSETRDSQSFLTIASSRHGGMNKEPFSGRAGTDQRNRLEHWLAQVQRGSNTAVARRSDSRQTGSGIRRAAYRGRGQHDSGVRPAVHTADRDADQASQPADEFETEALTDARRRNRRDAFDPEIFNRRYRVPAGAAGADSGQTVRRSP